MEAPAENLPESGISVKAMDAPQPEETKEADDVTPQPLSKNAMKKAAKAERYAVLKLERRAREKEAKKEKKRVLAEKRAAGELDEAEEEKGREAKRPRLSFGGTVVVDLGFDELMSEKEIKSLSSQLAYTYSANRNAAYPFSLIYSSLNGRTKDRLDSMNDAGYKRWTNTKWWEEGYERLWLEPTPLEASGQLAEAQTVNPPSDAGASLSSTTDPLAVTNVKQKVVYLTADSTEELTELDPQEVYIIGGIVDHNRYKNLCLNKANESGIRTARLPIGRYLAALPTRKVLTVNQVFEILLKWVETRDWEEALHAVIPKRKFQVGNKKDGNNEVEETKEGEVENGVQAPQEEEEREEEGVDL